jgi:hypothetical protein
MWNIAGHKIAPIEAKVVLVHVLRAFQVFTPQKVEDVKMVNAALAAPYPDILLQFKPRRHEWDFSNLQ